MGFSYLFIFQLRTWFYGLGPPDLDSGPDLFDPLIFDLLLFNFCIPWPFILELIFQTAQALQSDITSWKGSRPSYFRNRQASNLFDSAEANDTLRVGLQQADQLTIFQGGSMESNNARLFILQYYCRLSYGFY